MNRYNYQQKQTSKIKLYRKVKQKFKNQRGKLTLKMNKSAKFYKIMKKNYSKRIKKLEKNPNK